MRKTLRQIYKEHNGKVSDKWTLYLIEWDQLFASYRDLQIQLLEIGVQNGGSLEIWAKYFLKAEKIVGCDIDPKCGQLRYDDARITVVVGDANSEDCENKILQQAPTLDIIIDDGSHKSSDVVRSFARYFPHLNNDGIYVIEDLHTSYWKGFEGGLHNPLSSIAFLKRLVDVSNYEHWRNDKLRGSLLTKFKEEFDIEFSELDLSRIHSVEFLNSLCIIKKLPTDKNVLGKRRFVGKDEWVTNNLEEFIEKSAQDIALENQDNGNIDVFELTAQMAEREQTIQTLTDQVAEREQTIQTLTDQVAEREQTVQTLTAQLAERDAELISYALSNSWRITRPLRKLKNLIRRREKCLGDGRNIT